MRRTAVASVLVGLVLSGVLAAGCGSGGDDPQAVAGSGTTKRPAGDPSTDKLAQVLARGTLVLFTDPAYPPQSVKVKARRPAGTRCAANELTAPEVKGFDADTGKLVSEALGVEPCFVTPSWTEVTGGNWGDRWDLAYGSGAFDFGRMEVLYMTRPYYSTPTNFFVAQSSDARKPADLSDKQIGACAGCTMEKYLRGTLELPGPKIEQLVEDPEIVTYDTEIPGLKATARGEIDAFLCSEPVGAAAIADGAALRKLKTPAYYSFKTGYVDKESGLSVTAFIGRINEIVAALHADGTLERLSEKYFGKDYATKAAEFDLEAIEQDLR